MVGKKGRLLVSTAVLLGLAVPATAQTQTQSTTRSNSIGIEDINRQMTAPKYSRDTPMGSVDARDNLGNHKAEQALDMSSFGIYNLGDINTSSPRPDQAANKRYVDQVGAASRDNLGNHTATQHLNMGTFQVRLGSDPSGGNDAARKSYVDARAAAARDNLGNHLATQLLNMGGYTIVGLPDPTADLQAANKRYVDQVGNASRDNLGNHTATVVLNMSAFRITNVGAPVDPTDGATKQYVDTVAGGVATDVANLRSRRIDTSTGLLGGGDLSANRTLRFDTTWGDGRYALASRTIAANDGLSGGGAISGNVGLSVDSTVVRTSGNQTLAGTKTFSSTISGSINGNAATATRLQTARTINGVSFNGAANITLPTVNLTGDQVVGGAKTFSSPIDIASGNQLRLRNGTTGPGFLMRNDGTNTYFMLTADGQAATGTYNALRPLYINNTTGMVSMGHGARINGAINVSGGRIDGVLTPTAAAHAVNKAYVDTQIAGAVNGISYLAGSGLTLSGKTFAVDATVVRTTGNQTLAGTKTFSSPIVVNGSFNVDGSGPGTQANGLYVADLGTTVGSTGNPTTTAVIGAQLSSTRSIALSVDAAGRVWGFRSHNGTGPFTWRSRVAEADTLTTPRGINGVAFDGSAAITLPTVNLTGNQTVAGVKTFSSTISGSINGNAATATRLQTARTINGVSFNGAANITLPTVNTSGAQDVGGVKTFTATIDAANVNAIRLRAGTTGSGLIIRNDGNTSYFLLTNSGAAETGSYNALRPLSIANATGRVVMGNGLTLTGGLNVSGGINANSGRISNLADPSADHHATTRGWVNTQLATRVPTGRAVNTGVGLSGGGNLSANRTLTIADDHRRRAAHSDLAGVMAFAGHNRASGQFYGGSTNPNQTDATYRLNYNGFLYATRFYSNMYLYFSDRNLKENIETISQSEGMATVRKLRPVSYDWKESGAHAKGVIAQEIEEVMPSAVSTNEVGIKAVDYVQMIAPMLAAIQELDARVKALESAEDG